MPVFTVVMHYTMNLDTSPLNFTSSSSSAAAAVAGGTPTTARADTPPASALGVLPLGEGGGMGPPHLGLHPGGSPSGITSASAYMLDRKLEDMGGVPPPPPPGLVDGSGLRGRHSGAKSMEIQNSTINSLVDEDFLNHYKVHEITGGVIPALSPPPPPAMGPGGPGGYSPYNYPHPYDFYPTPTGKWHYNRSSSTSPAIITHLVKILLLNEYR